MMKKNVLVAALGLLLIGSCMTSCKPKKSAYRSMYEKAKQHEIAQQSTYPQEEPIVVADNSDVREEKLSVPEGESAPNGIRTFSVCIGSFKNITNARSLRERMISEGYGEAILAQNESGMYRVLVTGHDTKEAAVRSRDAIMRKYAPAFSDAWIVRRAY